MKRRQAADSSYDARFEELSGLAHRVAFRLLGSSRDAEDVAQEAMARAFARWRRVRGHAEPWVVRVATNLALDVIRRRRRRPESALGDVDLTVPVAGSAVHDVSADRIELARVLAELPRRQREAVVLRFLVDRSEAETAAALGTSVGSVKTHTHRGLAALRASWSETDTESGPTHLTDAPTPGAP